MTATSGTPPFNVYLTSELSGLAPPTYLLDQFLVADGLNVLWGPSGTFKSFLAVDWALSIAAGRMWHQRPVCLGMVVYIAGEGSRGLLQRVEAWADACECAAPEMYWITEPINLHRWPDVDALIRWADELEHSPVLLVVDTLARCMEGADENSTKDVGLVIAHLDQLRRRCGTAALIVHHTGHDNTSRERGSSALRGAADISIGVRRGGRPRVVELSAAKVKDAAPFDDVELHLEAVSGSLVVAMASAPTDRQPFEHGKGKPSEIASWIRTRGGSATQREICRHYDISRSALFNRRQALEECGVIFVPGPQGTRGTYVTAQAELRDEADST